METVEPVLDRSPAASCRFSIFFLIFFLAPPRHLP